MSPDNILKLYVEKATELVNSKIAMNNFAAFFSITTNEKGQPSLHSHTPDEENLKSFLVTFRHFVSENEPIFLNKSFNLCRRHIINKEIISEIDSLYKSWKQYLKNDYLQFLIDDKVLSPNFISNIWINGKYFHSDEEYGNELKSLNPLQYRIYKIRFLNYLVNTSRHIFSLCSFIIFAYENSLFDFNR